jgi:hypothetical protein
VPGNNVHLNRYKDLSVTSSSGGLLKGIVSATYSLRSNINTIFATGNNKPVATYTDIPEIDVSYTGYAGKIEAFSVDEANNYNTITINGKNGGVSCNKALLTSVVYNLSVDEPFTISKTFRGYVKPSASGGSSSIDETYHVIRRQDYSGSLPAGISGNHLQKVSAEISIERQPIIEFARRQPYASIINYPLKRSITYEVFSDSLDSITIEDLNQACQNPSSSTYEASISACGVSFSISNAYVSSINYSGGEAQNNGSPQTISITYTTYDNIEGLKPIVLFEE